MKKFFLLVSFVLVGLLIHAQSSTHLFFEGIPIEGSVEEFGKKLKEKGFTQVDETDSIKEFKFIGNVNPFGLCSVFLTPNPNIGDIAAVILSLPKADNSWIALSVAYTKAKDVLEQQYGKPFFTMDTFNSEEQPVTDAEKIKELKHGNCKHITVYTAVGGSMIVLTITYNENDGGQVVVIYGSNGLGELMSMAMNGEKEVSGFEGIPIEGTVEDFSKALLEKDFTQTGDNEFIGNLGNYGRCEIQLMTVPDTDQVMGYVMIFPKKDADWAELSATYFSIKELFRSSYGEPESCKETFELAKQPVTDADKLLAVNNDKCRYSTNFFFPEAGGVILSIVHVNDGNQISAFVTNRNFGKHFVDQMSHLKFMGIPIDGPLNLFVDELEDKGLREVPYFSQEGVTVMQGTFAGYRDCNIYVFHSDDKGKVKMVAVSFPSLDKWEHLSSNYFSIKEKLTKKYGEPYECVEEFQSAPRVIDDLMKMHFVETDRCKYSTKFYAPGGVIQLSITHIKVDYKDYCNVHLIYNDGVNSLLERDNSIDDL